MRLSGLSALGLFLSSFTALSTAACAGSETVTIPANADQASDSSGTIPASDASSFCAALCDREESCDKTLDRQTCVNACTNKNAALFPRLRQDVVSNILECVGEKDCKTVLDGGLIGTCATEAVARVAPTDAAVGYCSALSSAMQKCGTTQTKAQCLESAKLYSDDAIAEARNCAARKCSDISACVAAVFGGFTGDGPSNATTKTCGRTFPELGSCSSCAEDSCCAQATACAADSECAYVMQACSGASSSSGSSSSACYSATSSVSSYAQQLASQYLACARSSCSSSCSY
jgi:hypothetical protein